MKIFKNLFGSGDRIHSDNIEVGTSGNHRNLSDSVIVESGSNANGKYIKFGDGTMICSGLKDFTTPTDTNVAENSITFASAFYNTAYSLSLMQMLPHGSLTYGVLTFGISANGVSEAYFFFNAMPNNLANWDSAVTVRISYIAIGRWKA